MRKIYVLSVMILSVFSLNAQSSKQEKDTVFVEQIYQDLSTYLVSQRVLEFDSVKASELMIRFENWAGQNFRNYEKVRTSKTESQITLNYITSSFSTSLDFYLNMVVEFKDNKIRVQIYDDANVYKPGSYSGTTYIAGVAGRAYHISAYFNNGMIIYKPKPGMLNINEKNASGSLTYKASVDATIEEINTYIKTKSVAPATKKDDSGW